MLILRLVLLLSILLLVLSGVMYVLTHDQRYKKFAVQVIRFLALFLALFLILMLLERYVLTAWLGLN